MICYDFISRCRHQPLRCCTEQVKEPHDYKVSPLLIVEIKVAMAVKQQVVDLCAERQWTEVLGA